jgi:hypothetical protein
MPMRVTQTAAPGGGKTYIRIIRSGNPGIHQRKLDISAWVSAADADGFLPPGLPIIAGGLPVSGAAQVAIGVIGPEGIEIGDGTGRDIFANSIDAPAHLNGQAIADNKGSVLSANQLAALAAGGYWVD